MTINSEPERLKDGALEQVSGGGINYNIQDDPLYKKFAEILGHEEDKGEKATGMESRAGFLDEFQDWLRAGSPENIAKWYMESKRKAFG
ncbi:MAG: hypothetical protein K5985_02830 [Lachnospiraceae bacterium]|nr:hypothetical protein [Lachnospiraceae bacterium]